MKDYEFAVKSGRKLLNNFPLADQQIRRNTWLVIAHASFELANYKEGEEGYLNVLQLTAENDKTRQDVVENLAAAIYKQGEQANKLSDFKTAAEHFLRVAVAAPTSKIRSSADYDGATALMQLKDWERAAEVLLAFRSHYAGHKLQADVTKKIAYVYKEAGKLALAAAEYERIETETQDVAIRREALQLAADLYVDAKDTDKAMQVYRRYVSYFPKPLEPALETRNKIADVLKSRNETVAYLEELKQIVAADARAGAERTDRTRYLGATASLVLTEPLFAQFAEIKLLKPFDKNLNKKKVALKTAKEGFEKLMQYEVGDVTSAATYYIAEMYFNFNRALVESERPDDLNALELEQYELAIEEQAYPFEEKAIQIHEKNLELLSLGIYGVWIDNSIGKLAKLMPARYAKFEESSGYIEKIDTVSYAALTDPVPVLAIVVPPPVPVLPLSEPVPVPVEPAPAEPIVEVVAPVQQEEKLPVAAKKTTSGKKVVKAKNSKAPAQGK
jgi:cellulose synthase operon protein C